MFNPLALKQEDCIEINLSEIETKTRFICQSIINFTDAQQALACRYQLTDQNNGRELWLEVKKDRAQNYQLFYYEKIEEMDSDPSFLAVVGTSTIKYQNPHVKEDKHTIYNRIPKKGEIVMPVKHLVEEEDLPESPQEYGYHKDGNHNWYFMTKRSEGTLKNFDNNLQRRSWEYKHEQERLLIEMPDHKNAVETQITIYEGREIARKNLKKVNANQMMELI
ncbi:MAG: hypothetical protein K0U47_04645 [Epsilonproteobacteria bacterium]|nr:hypothetical protein [Campylobacterota bacterium]